MVKNRNAVYTGIFQSEARKFFTKTEWRFQDPNIRFQVLNAGIQRGKNRFEPQDGFNKPYILCIFET